MEEQVRQLELDTQREQPDREFKSRRVEQLKQSQQQRRQQVQCSLHTIHCCFAGGSPPALTMLVC